MFRFGHRVCTHSPAVPFSGAPTPSAMMRRGYNFYLHTIAEPRFSFTPNAFEWSKEKPPIIHWCREDLPMINSARGTVVPGEHQEQLRPTSLRDYEYSLSNALLHPYPNRISERKKNPRCGTMGLCLSSEINYPRDTGRA